MRIDARGLTFDLSEGGPAGGTPVLLLHGFPQDRREWDLVAPRLHAAGLRTYALDQRGYSRGARPAAVTAYRMSECVADAVAVLDRLGLPSAHVVGHDWGATVGWHLAVRHPGRVVSLTAVSVPHPRALEQTARRHPTQALRLGYVLLFRRRGLAERLLLAGDGFLLRRMMRPAGRERAAAFAGAMREAGRLTGALNWYRAGGPRDIAGLGPSRVPTTYVWSGRDGVVSRRAALRCAGQVAADYRFVELPGISHWVADQAPEDLAGAILARVHA